MDLLEQINKERLPKHVAIIMDGNGRWAKKQGFLRAFGHESGTKSVKEIIKASVEIGIENLTLYAFSTENWSRPEDEVKFIMNLPVEFFDKYVPELDANNVKVQVIGETDRLPKDTFDAMKRACEKTKHNSGLILNFALNYGGRSEITEAVKNIAQEVLEAKINPDDITEDVISNHLMTNHLPYLYRDPDLIIRTSGELRLSNFLPWQSAYSEFYFTPVLWPDFKKDELIKAITEYNRRHRRFGGI